MINEKKKINIHFHIYEILSTSFGFALLAFFGTLSFFPIEIMFLGEEQTWFWTFIFLNYSVVIAFLLHSFYRKASLKLLRIFDTISTLCSILVIAAFLIHTNDQFEPWFVQGAWFLRDNGIIMGFFMGFTMIKTTLGMTFITSKFNEKQANNEKTQEILILLVLTFSLSFYISLILVYRDFNFLSMLLLIFVVQTCLLMSSLLLISNSNSPDRFTMRIRKKVKEESDERSNKNEKFVEKTNFKLVNSGTEPKNFWKSLFPLFFITMINIFITILYPFNVFVTIYIPRPFEIPLIQILSYVSIALMLFILTINAFKNRIIQKYVNYPENTKVSRRKIALFGQLDANKFLGIFLVLSQLLYFFKYPIYFPRVISNYLLWSILGALIYYFFGTSQRKKNKLYVCAIITLVINILISFIDGLIFGESIIDGSFDTFFPFLYLHSWLNYIIVGIPIGIILSDLLLNSAFKHVQEKNISSMASCFAYAAFTFGLILMPGNYYLGNPGGYPSWGGTSFVEFLIFCIILGVTLINGLIFHFFTEIKFQKIYDKNTYNIEVKRKIKYKINLHNNFSKEIFVKKWNIKPVFKKNFVKRKIAIPKNLYQEKANAIYLAIIILISLFGGMSVLFTFQETRKRPVVAYSPGNYYMWLQSSSERVSKETSISIATSPRVNSVNLSLAKNEYGAFQLVWHPLSSKNYVLTYKISNFINVDNPSFKISKDCFSLRYEEFVLENEVADILVPFVQLKMNEMRNYIFWFSVRTPEDTLKGTYEGELTLNLKNNEIATIPIKLNVWNFHIPKTRHLRMNIGPYNDKEETLENYKNHRFNDYGVLLRRAASIEQLKYEERYTYYLNARSNSWTFNWTWWDNVTATKLEHGMNAIAIKDPIEWENKRNPDLNNTVKIMRLRQWLKEVQSHLEKKGWLKYAYYYFIDEFNLNIPLGYTRQEYFKKLENFLLLLKWSAPKLKIMATVPPLEEYGFLEKYFDIFCPVSETYDKEKWEALMDEGKEFWYYPCIGPFAPWPNSHLYNRLYECRVLLWQTWLYRIQGYLYWDSRYYGHGAYGMAGNGYGDGWFLYERFGKLCDSLRWENYLDGVEDYEYLWLLDAVLDHLEKNPWLLPVNEIINFRAEFNNIINSIVGEKWEYCDHPSTLLAGRNRIGTILDYLSKVVNIASIGEEAWFP